MVAHIMQIAAVISIIQPLFGAGILLSGTPLFQLFR